MEEKKRRRQALGSSSTGDYMMEHHTDLLQNIEFAIIDIYRDNKDIDDRIIAKALQSVVLDEQPQNDLVASLLEALAQIREVREDVCDDLWRDGLRTVLQSVERHSNLKPGKRYYIEFVLPYIY